MLTDREIKQNLKIQTKFWNNADGYEKGQTQQFWNSILRAFDSSIDPKNYIQYEKQVKDPASGNTKFIDGYIAHTRVMIEQKSSKIDLSKPESQSGGAKLTPFEQAARYDNWLPLNERAKYIICSNFRTIEIHDRNRPLEPPFIIPFTEDGIEKNFHRLKFLLDPGSTVSALEVAVSKNAAALIGEIYSDITKLYTKEELTPVLLRQINIFCVRLVFCVYAEDSLVFRRKDMFGEYLKKFNSDKDEFRRHVRDVFKNLNTPNELRDPDDHKLNEFPYTNGGLFAEEYPIPRLKENIAFKITQKMSLEFDWSPINPSIFGSMFESTLSAQSRREGGMHYTTTDNINKAVGPLFLNSLRMELMSIIEFQKIGEKCDMLLAFQQKLASIQILDPACGSGNFLTYIYMELRRMENKVLYELNSLGYQLPENPILVSISQVHGFEINDFAVDTAKTALWIAQNQLLHETKGILKNNIPELPLANIDTIHCVNALTVKWESLADPQKINYIVGNPPFVGARLQTEEQKAEVINIFGQDWKNVGNLDYVCCWYKLAVDFMKQNPKIKCALVSTNSICQGEQVANLWQPLFEDGLVINFAYTTFRWESDSNGMAHVHCIIVGFALEADDNKYLFNAEGVASDAKNINAYLVDGPNVFVESRKKPISKVPEMVFGNMPNDGGNLIIEGDEYYDFISLEPKAKPFIKSFVGAEEFINNKKRYCLWLKDVNPLDYANLPTVMNRIKAVRDLRLASNRAGTKKKAETPMLFGEIRQPDSDYLLIPCHSSETRKYIPIGYMCKDIISSNACQIIPNATLYEFSILTSSVHNIWMRLVAGRLKSDYRYSKDVVYNNFPWPEVDDATKKKIGEFGHKILDVRAKYLSDPKCSLATLYGENLELIFGDLNAAHKANDKAVLGLYGLAADASDEQVLEEVMERYVRMRG